MRHHGASRLAGALSALTVAAVLATCAVGVVCGAEATGARTIGAKVINAAGGAAVGPTGGTSRALTSGDYVYFGEDVTVPKGGSVTLALSDKTLREFAGPATVSIRRDASPSGGSVIGNLTAAVADMLFSGKVRMSDAVMATRSAQAGPDAAGSVPVLIHPAPGENLLEAPKQFAWKGLEGVPLYRVSVYSASQMMWQGTTSETKAGCPPKTCEFRPGEVYYWVVEAVVGNTTLRSRAADFTVLGAADRSALAAALAEADQAVSDAMAAMALKARLCLDGGVYAKALDVIDQSIGGTPTRTAYLLRAEAHGAMGLAEEAVGDYRAAIALPAGE
jgi:hypothetical protein